MKKLVLVAAAFLLAGTAGLTAADFSGNGTNDIAIFRPSSGLWAVRGMTRIYFGTNGDVPAPGDYNGNGISDFAIFRPNSGLWAIRGVTRAYFGQTGDQAVFAGSPSGEGGGWDYKVPNNTLLSFRDSGGGYAAGIRMATNDHLWIGNPVTDKNVYILADGDISLMSGSAGGANLTINDIGTVVVSYLSAGTVYSTAGGALTNTAPSSSDYKDAIKPIDLQADRILRLEPKSFVWKENGQADFGYIAEEVKEVLPELYREDGSIKGYDPARLSFYLTEVVKAQDKRLAALEEEIRTLKAKLTAGE